MNSIELAIEAIEEKVKKGNMTFEEEQGAYQAWLDLKKELRYKDN
jgi:hypothetical protein|tara:strand:+ start:584 stop:718 length:135 start_codon:yes stop_codon:yes gene_type:complete